MSIITTSNPYDDSILKEYEVYSTEKVERIISKCHVAFQEWSQESITRRSLMMARVGDVLIERKEYLARLAALEMGKPLGQAIAEIEKCSKVCYYYAKNSQNFLENEYIKTDAGESYVSYRPLGVILAIMPWNFPYWQVFRFAAPTLCAGNTALLKHASNVSGCSLAIEEIFSDAGFPQDVFRSVITPPKNVKDIIENERIKAVTITGSTSAGKSVAENAGKCLKKTVLELGGSDAYIILEDADLDHAAKTCVASRLINAGQSCIAGKRFIAEESVYEEFKERVVSEMQKIRMGDPMDIDVQMGPLAKADLRDQLHDQVKRSIKAGATCVLGGEIPSGGGSFYPPTILSEVTEHMPAYHEELFGPVAILIKARNEEEAIRVANDTTFGLGAGVFTKNIEHGKEIAEFKLEAGTCVVNRHVQSDPRLPFGGIKESGYGRELAEFGIKEFVNIKSVEIN